MDTIDGLFERQHGTTQCASLEIALFGLNERSRAAIATVLKTAPNLACNIADESRAEAGIIDTDGPGGEAMLADVRRRFPDLMLVALSSAVAAEAPKIPNVLHLYKPVQVSRLLLLLEEIAQALVSRPAGGRRKVSAAAVRALENCLPNGQRAARLGQRTTVPGEFEASLADPELRKQWFFSEEESICGLILHVAKACMADQIPRLIAYMGQWISILPKLGLVDGDLTPIQLKQFAYQRFQETGASSFDVSELSFESQTEIRRKTVLASAHCVSLDAFAWKVAAAASRGRAPEGTDLEAPMAMRHWPNMTRLQPLPHALRVAALWDAGPRSLRDIAEALGVKLASVLTIYTAASSIGLVVPAVRQVDSLLQPLPLRHPEQSGLFERVQERLNEDERGTGGGTAPI